MHRVISAVLAALLCFICIPRTSAAESPAFIRGMDISSVLSLEKSGVRFFDESGREDDIFRILAENGVNYIRVRVWTTSACVSGIIPLTLTETATAAETAMSALRRKSEEEPQNTA